MKRPRGILLFALIGAATVAALLAHPSRGEDTLGDGTAFPIALLTEPEVAPPPEEDTSANLPDSVADSDLVVSTPYTAMLAESSPMPDAIEASDLLGQPLEAHSTSLPASPAENGWTPPSLHVPLARHPYDHYWFIRPVSSDHTNTGLLRYPYGSDGSNNELRIHHGIDIANPVGVEVHAVGDGVVVWAGRGHYNAYESITAYGNTVVIQHDLGYQGKTIYTLYAHLSAILIEPGQRVTTGHVLGLIGATGQVSGPHVHLEIREDRNSYFAVRNPDLWLAPYVGTGVIAGRVSFPSGQLVDDVEVRVINLGTGRTAYRTSTYAGFGVNADDRWNENFAIPDVPVGHYVLSASYGATRWTGEVHVQEGMTNWVEMQIQTPDSIPPTATPGE